MISQHLSQRSTATSIRTGVFRMRSLLLLALLTGMNCSADWTWTIDGTCLLTLTPPSGSAVSIYPSWQTSGENVISYFGGAGGSTHFFNPASSNATDGTTFCQQHYTPGGAGGAGDLTKKVTYSKPDSITLKAHVVWTSGDTTYNIVPISDNTIFPLSIGANTNTTGTTDQATGRDVAPVSFWSGSWGSIAMWGDYATVGENISTTGWTTGNKLTSFVANSITVGPNNPLLNPQTTYQTVLTPLGTITEDFYLRLGSPSDTLATLAPEAFVNYQAALSPTYLHPNRKVACSWFMSENAARSANNPRGYFYPNANTDPTGFLAAGLALADVVRTNCESAHGQVVIMWDSDGSEAVGLKYLGKPRQLAEFAPDMNGIFDAVVAELKSTGLEVGVTLRPQLVLTATPSTLPAGSNNAINSEYNSIAYNTANTGYTDPNLTYQCLKSGGCPTPGDWTADSQGPGYQTAIPTVAGVVAELESQIDAAYSRSHMQIFYVDSTGWPGYAFQEDVWRTIHADRPNVTLFVESYRNNTYATTSVYLSTNNLSYQTDPTQRLILPGSWSMITYPGCGVHTSEVRTGIANGDVYLIQAFFDDGSIACLVADGAAAAVTNSSLTITDLATGRLRSFGSRPMTDGTIPYHQIIRYADTENNLNSSTTYCDQQATPKCYASGVLQTTAVLNLSGFAWWRPEYWTFDGVCAVNCKGPGNQIP